MFHEPLPRCPKMPQVEAKLRRILRGAGRRCGSPALSPVPGPNPVLYVAKRRPPLNSPDLRTLDGGEKRDGIPSRRGASWGLRTRKPHPRLEIRLQDEVLSGISSRPKGRSPSLVPASPLAEPRSRLGSRPPLWITSRGSVRASRSASGSPRTTRTSASVIKRTRSDSSILPMIVMYL